jgi:hypothetical protein
MMKAAAMADNAAHVQQLRVVRELEVQGDGRPLFELTGQDQAHSGGTEVRRFTAAVHISAVFEYAHLNGNRDPMALSAPLRFVFTLFNQYVSREGKTLGKYILRNCTPPVNPTNANTPFGG